MIARRAPRPAALLALTCAVALAASCGARVTPEQVASVRTGGTTSGAAPSNASDQAQGSAVSSSTGRADAGAASADAAHGTLPSGTDAHQATQAAEDNGGATDVGITASTVTLGNVATLSGPVPGLFAGAVIGTRAFLAYQNSLGGIHGRQLKLESSDDQFDTGQNRARSQELMSKVFAFVGGFSLYDDAPVDLFEKNGIADVQVSLTPKLQVSPINFSTSPTQQGAPTGPFEALKKLYPNAVGAVGGIYGDVPAQRKNWLDEKATAESLGYKYVYDRAYQVTETDFTADVIRMRSAGVKFVFTNGDVKTIARLAKAMQAQGFKPDAFVTLTTGYDATLIPLAGDAAQGLITFQFQSLYEGEDAAQVPEVTLMNKWIQQVKPGYKPDQFAAFGWASARLFAQALNDAGPRPTRAGLLAALRKIDHYDANGLIAETGPASKRPAVCFIFVRVNNGKYERFDSPQAGFRCDNSVFFTRPS